MRIVNAVLAIVCVLAGVLFGALNPDAVDIDFYFFSVRFALGAALLIALLAGALLGGLILWLGVIWPLRRRLAAYNRIAARETAVRERDAAMAPNASESLT